MDKGLSQDIERIGGDDRYTKASKGHDEDSGRSQHNDDGDRRLNSKS